MPTDNRGKSYSYNSSGTNSNGNHYCSRNYSGSGRESGQPTSSSSSKPSGDSAYHYSNSDGSYYYSNSDGSKYHNDGNGGSSYTPSSGKK